MTKTFLARPSRAEVNGVDVSHIMNFSIDRLERRSQTIQCLDYNHDVDIHFGEYAEGTLEFAPVDRRYANDPASALDVLGFALGHLEYDTTAEEVELIQTDNLDSRAGTSADIAGTQRIVEIRQTEATSSQKIDIEGAEEEVWAQSFVAGGEDIYKVSLKLYDTAASKIETFDLEIWSDSAGVPNAQVPSTNTVTVYASAGTDTELKDYIGALTSGTGFGDATWETIDMSLSLPDIMDGESLTIGTTYWLLIKNTTTTTDDLFVCYTSNDWYDGGECKRDDNLGSSPAWGDATAGAEDLSFIIQFYTDDGLQLDFYDYATTTTGMHYSFKKVKCTNASGLSVSPMQVAQGSLKWTSEDVVISTI